MTREESKILPIALNTRQWGSDLLREINRQGYTGYIFDPDFTGLCAVSSYIIWKNLRKIRLKPSFCVAQYGKHVDNGQHAFVLCNGFLVDTTHTQFNENFCYDVIVQKYNDEHRDQWFWRIKHRINSEIDINNRLRHWHNQNPFGWLNGRISPDSNNAKIVNTFSIIYDFFNRLGEYGLSFR